MPNSIALGPPHGALVTGSNMSGKSTLLRTVGSNVVLAQTINTCLAGSYEAPVYQVRSCIGRADDLIAHLTPGPATSRNAIALLELNGAPESVVKRALERAAALDRQRRQWTEQHS